MRHELSVTPTSASVPVCHQPWLTPTPQLREGDLSLGQKSGGSTVKGTHEGHTVGAHSFLRGEGGQGVLKRLGRSVSLLEMQDSLSLHQESCTRACMQAGCLATCCS